jgi:hypothetical protein
MRTYEIIPQSQATAVEFDFLKLVSAKAREFAGNIEIANAQVSGKKHIVEIACFDFLNGVLLDLARPTALLLGLRPAWLNTMADLCESSADLNRHVSSQHSAICSEIESTLYRLALAYASDVKIMGKY